MAFIPPAPPATRLAAQRPSARAKASEHHEGDDQQARDRRLIFPETANCHAHGGADDIFIRREGSIVIWTDDMSHMIHAARDGKKKTASN